MIKLNDPSLLYDPLQRKIEFKGGKSVCLLKQSQPQSAPLIEGRKYMSRAGHLS